MILHCHGRLRIPDDGGRRYKAPCYDCARFDHLTDLWPEARMKPPAFDVACPAWLPKPERNLADESWPEER